MEKLNLIESEIRKKIVLMHLNQVLDYAVLLGFISNNPASNLWRLFYKKENKKIKLIHFASIHYNEVEMLDKLFVVKEGRNSLDQSQLATAFLLLSLCSTPTKFYRYA